MPAIEPAYKQNFDTLQQAFQHGDVCLTDCRDRQTGATRRVVCAVNREASGAITMVPLATLFDGDPYDLLDPPGYDLPTTPAPVRSRRTRAPRRP